MHKDVIMSLEKDFIHADEQLEILEILNNWLHHHIFNYKSPSAKICDPVSRPANNFRIITNKKKFDLYFRFGETWVKDGEKTIVIARIGFEKRRVGYGTSLLKLLTEIAIKFDYKYIAIESVNANSRAFAKKFGFEEHMNNNNYIIFVNKLASGLFTHV